MIDPLSSPISLSVSPRSETKKYPTRFLLKRAEEQGDYIIEVDYSGMSLFMKCPRAAENYHVRRRELATDQSALSFGRLFHKLEDKRIRAGLTEATITAQHETIAAHFVEHPPSPTDHRTSDMMFQTIKTYNERYKNDSWDKKVFIFEGKPFVERPFKIEFCTIEVNAGIPYPSSYLVEDGNEQPLYIKRLHVVYIGRIDLVLEDVDKLWVVDNKTSSMGGQQFEEAFRLSLQTRGYDWVVWKITGRMPMGCIVNGVIVRKPTKTGKGTEFNRPVYFYSEDSILEWEECMKAHVSDFVGCLVRGFWPQSAQSFKSPCAGCDYQDNCALPRSQRAADLASDIYRNVTWNPLLEQ